MSDVMFAVLRYVKDQQKLELSVYRCYTIKRFDPLIAAADVNEGISYFNFLSNDPLKINRPIGVLTSLQIISSKNNLSHMCSGDLFSLGPLKSLNISYIACDASEAATAKRRTRRRFYGFHSEPTCREGACHGDIKRGSRSTGRRLMRHPHAFIMPMHFTKSGKCCHRKTLTELTKMK